ncbi:MAG: aldo/keto reductase [Hyphomicrobiaceae bacterium]
MDMQYTTLGRTGLKVSVAGLGAGGNSRLGMDAGATEAESVALVRTALDLGVNFIDTAEAYGTETIVGKAVAALPRDSVVLSTKSRIEQAGKAMSAAAVVANLDASLKRLGTDHVDIYHLHGVAPDYYDHCLTEIVPALERERARGKLRHLGITETSPRDPDQHMLQRAVADAPWDVVMLAFHMMHQVARRALLPATQRARIGTLAMFVVRNIFSRPDLLRATLRDLAAAGRVPGELAEADRPLSFLLHAGGAASLTEAAYRYARHEPGIDVVLFGTGSVAHLKQNVADILKPPLPPADVARLDSLFGALSGVGLDLPNRLRSAAPSQG